MLGPVADQRVRTVWRGIEVGLLDDPLGADAAGPGDGAGVGRLRAGDQPQQGRLARPVLADHPDAVALADAQREVSSTERLP